MAETRHQNWDADALWRQLDPLLPGLSVEVVARVESTNSELIERARRFGGSRAGPVTRSGGIDSGFDNIQPTPLGRRSADTQPSLLVAEHQTRGRGRFGRAWLGSAGASLTFSLALPFEPASWRGLSLAVGVAIADALEAPVDGVALRIGLKWPNDLWLIDEQLSPGRSEDSCSPPRGADAVLRGRGPADMRADHAPGRKLGGILIETVAVGERRMCVIGVGLNVHPQPVDGVSNGYASLDELDPAVSAPAALARIALPLVRALQRFEGGGFASFAPAFAARDLLFGRRVTTTSADCPGGVAAGVDDSGALRVRAEHDRLHLISSGDVSVRLDDPDSDDPRFGS